MRTDQQQVSTGARHPAILGLSLIASFAFDYSRALESAWPIATGCMAAVSAVIIMSVGWWLGRNAARRSPPSFAISAFAIGAIAGNLIMECVARCVFDFGQAAELVMLESLRNLMLALAAVAVQQHEQRLTAALSLFFMVLVSAVSEGPVLVVCLALYALVGLVWLMDAHWQRVCGGLAATQQRRLSWNVRWVACVLLMVGMTVIAYCCPRDSTTIALAGFLPTSGGTGDFDPFARAGVNDGDAIVAAKSDAQSVGPVNSKIFLTGDQPSLYDALTDLYGEPAKPKEQDRAVALGSEEVREEKPHATATKNAREFSAIRRGRSKANRRPPDTSSPAMFFVAGRTPLHLRLETFDHFDGRDWTHRLPSRSELIPTAHTIGERTWFQFGAPYSAIDLGEQRIHQLKIVNLHTNRIPLPPETVATHIERVDAADFFGVLNDDALCLRGNLVVPPLTIVELRSQRATDESLSRAAFQTTPSVAPNYLSVDLPNCERLRTLALEWAGDRPAGYAQIDAIVRQLKAHCELDPNAVVPADAANAVTHFLFNSRRGPDYLFASSAVLLLRSIGYPARLCSGFYASPERYDRQSRSTPVLKCDVHVWAEVCCRGRYWLPIEPTPGYETLGPDRSLWQRVVAVVVVAVDWCVRHWPLWLASSLLLGVAAWQWRWCCDCVLFVLWWLSRWASPARHVLATVRYWELRAWLAGQRRPAGKALARWHAELRQRLAVPTIEPAFATVLAAAQRVLYAPRDTRESPITRSADEQKKWRTLCAATLQHWTVRQLRRATESHL